MRNNISSEAPGALVARVFPAVLIFVLLLAGTSGSQTIGIEVGAGVSEITRLDGSAHEIDQAARVVRALVQGDSLRQGSRVRVAEGSRIELRLPDDSYIRFDAGAVFELTALSADRRTGRRDISVNLVMGNVWATVSRLFPRNQRFDITTKTSVAGIRGTKYRMNVHPDQSAVVKVYEGAIEVKSADRAPDGPGRPGAGRVGLAPPVPVAGPHAVPGPHAVTMEEWVYIVRAMQQLVIRADGTAEKPLPFSYEEDVDDWVRWNQDRDEAVGLPAETDDEGFAEDPTEESTDEPADDFIDDFTDDFTDDLADDFTDESGGEPVIEPADQS